jgi:hypothetical protein
MRTSLYMRISLERPVSHIATNPDNLAGRGGAETKWPWTLAVDIRRGNLALESAYLLGLRLSRGPHGELLNMPGEEDKPWVAKRILTSLLQAHW